ncbi:hypothetical protein HPP92_023630 [Vanilla planifolia]|uniref:Uncharacterized protein n=1 Tax=Vanilla planifolia TaxID=51239 RepID=A0A835UBU0_VANPL|nr:hypothetical protein HPP92_023630 [Vanilla planifolia]
MASDGSDRAREVKVKSSVFRKGSHCAPSGAASCSAYGDHNKGHHLELNDEGVQLRTNHKGKFIRRKSAKKLVNTSFKRLRDDESECCKKNVGNFGCEAISNVVEFDSSRCTFDDKNLTSKQTRVHDGKRINKKNFRSTVKNKYECLIPKTGLSCGDTFASGNTIADLHDFAKHLDELSLSQLLDGSYKYHKLTVEKGKKSSVTNESILLSVRRACSILFPPTFSAAEKTNNLKESQRSQDPSFFMGSGSDCETKDHAESLLKPKAQNSFHENILGSTVLLPKKVVNQLTLPAPHELEDLLLNSSVSSTPLQIKNARSYTMTSFPSYHWSFYNGGNSRPTIEFCKLSSAKSASQGKWIRIGSSCTTIENDKNFLSGLVFKYECDEDFIKQQKITGILQDIKSYTPTFKPPSDGSSIKSMATCHDVEIPDYESVNRSGIPCSFK